MTAAGNRRWLLRLGAGATAALLLPLAAPAHGRAVGRQRAAMRALVAHEARAFGLPVDLALAVAKAESDFDPHALSHKGARGVMQIMPATAIGEYGIHPDLLWNPRINVRLGLHFLRRLIRRYRGRIDLALSYYNGGSAVGTWPRARVIPATAGYVRKVERLRRHYRRQHLTG